MLFWENKWWTSNVRTVQAKLLRAFLNQSVGPKDASWISRISAFVTSRPFVERSTLPVRMGCTHCMSFLLLTFAESQCQEWRSYSFSKETRSFHRCFHACFHACFHVCFDLGSISLQITALRHFASPVRIVASQVRPLTRTPGLIHAVEGPPIVYPKRMGGVEPRTNLKWEMGGGFFFLRGPRSHPPAPYGDLEAVFSHVFSCFLVSKSTMGESKRASILVFASFLNMWDGLDE